MTRAQPPMRAVVVGAGRAGGSFHAALSRCGWDVELVHHGDIGPAGENTGSAFDPSGGSDADAVLVLLCVPDSAVSATAGSLTPHPGRLVAHCAGSLGLDVLAAHPHVASLHPLVSMPDAEVGAARLSGAWFAVAGDPRIRAVVDALGGSVVEVPDTQRSAYHAAATVASNHLVALLDEVRRIARPAGVPLEAYLDLVRASVDNVADLGPGDALTGPVSRGDWATVRGHLSAIPASERQQYLQGAAAVAALAGVELPSDLRDGGRPRVIGDR